MPNKTEPEKEPIEKRLDCLILLNCLKDSSEKEKFKIVANCLGITETARNLGKDPSNFSKSINDKWGKKGKQEKKEVVDAKEEQGD